MTECTPKNVTPVHLDKVLNTLYFLSTLQAGTAAANQTRSNDLPKNRKSCCGNRSPNQTKDQKFKRFKAADKYDSNRIKHSGTAKDICRSANYPGFQLLHLFTGEFFCIYRCIYGQRTDDLVQRCGKIRDQNNRESYRKGAHTA